MSFIEKGAGFVQELFYRMIQVNRDHYGAAVCVGTCAMYRRKALIPFGGTAPIAYSEDLHTGFAVMSHGWRVRYFPINLAAGLCPDTVKSYFTQQYRWCMGSFTLMLSKDFWTAKKVSIAQRACFLTGMLYYITTAIGTVTTAIPSLMVLWFYPHLAHRYSVIFSLPSLLVSTVIIARWSNHRWGVYAIEARILAYWAHLFAIVDKLRGNLMPWVPTGNAQKNTRYGWFKAAFIFHSGTLTILLVVGAYRNIESVEIIPMVILTGLYRAIDLRISARLLTEG
jgi:cellulose synthase/poly-beta-1,6-N-acetylglucosamine synthase-like glycosyltransferase